jgi:hypothetical protein
MNAIPQQSSGEVKHMTVGERERKTIAGSVKKGAKWVAVNMAYEFNDMRSRLEEQQRNYVLGVLGTHEVWMAGCQQPVKLLAALLPEEAWVLFSVGEGSRGPRAFEWAWFKLPHEQKGGAAGRRSWLLVRRSLPHRSEQAYYLASGPAETMLSELASVTGPQ